jgi:signal transduction histidine kinase
MNFTARPQMARWFIIVSSLLIISLILWNVSLFFNQLKDAERSKMEVYGAAYKSIEATGDVPLHLTNKNANILSSILQGLQLKILTENVTIPVITYDHEGDVYTIINLKGGDNLEQAELAKLAQDFELLNEPIAIAHDGVTYSTLYYGNSPVIAQLKYFPLALLVIVVLFVALIYFYYLTSKASSQNLLWAGMAKETAHQIGTPLSSLVGWTEILRTENVNPEYLDEITKDINRLEVITDRFSKIGSKPDLKQLDIIEETKRTYDYLSKRSSKLIDFELSIPQGALPVMLNKQLFGWTLENMVKNAIDAMKGKGTLKVSITRDTRYAKIHITDTGKGIAKSKHKTIFEPGYTTKKRGWGLGLSLARRIIEEYHDGQVRVLKSEIDHGTTMEIALKLV